MARLRWIICALAVLAMTAGTAPAEEKAKPADEEKPKTTKAKKKAGKPKKAKSGLRGEYAMMAKQVELSDEQITKLKGLIKEKDEAVRNEAKASKQEMAGLRKALGAAKKAKDKAKMAEIQKKMKEARASSQVVKADYGKKIVGLLTAEQRGKWGQFVLYRSVCGKFAKGKLTKDQKKTVRSLCDPVAKELGDLAISAATAGDKEKADAAVKKLHDQITNQVLTDKQRKAMKGKAKANGKPAKGDRAKAKKKAKKAGKAGEEGAAAE